MKNRLTKIQKAIIATQILQILDGKRLYTEEEVADLKSEIAGLRATIAEFEAELPKTPDHKNIRGKEYYK